MNALGSILLKLYRVARASSMPEFRDAALEQIKPYLPFEKAMWGTFVRMPGGALVHEVHLHKLPARKMQDYEAIKQHDVQNQRAVAHPGRTFIANLSRMEKRLDPAMVAYVRRYDCENVLTTVSMDPAIGIYNGLALYRGEARTPFTERERRLKEQLMPHLVETWNLNAIQYMDLDASPAHRRHRARALIDRQGVLHNAETGFADLMRAEFPDWRGPQMPAELFGPLIGAGGESYRGDAVIGSRLREIGEGLFLVSVRPLAGVERLSPRELAVAREFAAGRTHKEIAQANAVAPATVRNQLQSVYEKLKVSSKTDLAKHLGEQV